ncbi:hypothetical protein AB6A40_007111 [Gnathostoma spinigerum]|uniref:Nucleotide-diphospho-sugar transferase domain-containing protein n=1 Tax=Gnathostoma spinigerum TaxID=75299 RepID=A0ABD6EUP0_9BILA
MTYRVTLQLGLLIVLTFGGIIYLPIYYFFIHHSNQRFLAANIKHLSSRDLNLQKGFGRSNSSVPNEHITVITILDNTMKLKDYALGLDTMRCYCKGHGYNYILLDLSTNNSFDKACKKQHIWYRRHCVLAEILKRSPSYNTSDTWFAVVDADTGVINPRHKIQEWIDETVDIIFYNRIWQFELAAGIFMVKKSSFAQKFVLCWSAYPDFESKSLQFSGNFIIHVCSIEFKSLPEI